MSYGQILLLQTQIRQLSGHRSTKILYMCLRAFVSDGVSRLGLLLETRLEIHF